MDKLRDKYIFEVWYIIWLPVAWNTSLLQYGQTSSLRTSEIFSTISTEFVLHFNSIFQNFNTYINFSVKNLIFKWIKGNQTNLLRDQHKVNRPPVNYSIFFSILYEEETLIDLKKTSASADYFLY